MSDNKLEKQFREKVDGHVSPIDSDALWNDIQKKRGKEEPSGKKRIILILLLGFLLAGGVFYFSPNMDTNLNKKPDTSSGLNANSIANSSSTTSSKGVDNLSERSKSDSNKVKTSDFNKAQESESSQSNAQAALSDLSSISNSDSIKKTKKNSKVVPSKIDTKNAPLNFQHNSNSGITHKDYSEQKFNELSIKKSISIPNILIQNTPEDKKEDSYLTKELNQVSSNTDTKLIAENSLSLTDKIASLELNLLKFDIAQPSAKTIPNLTNKGKSKFEIGATYNYEYAFRKLNNLSSDSIGSIYADIRDDSEKFIESYRVGLFLRHNFKHKFRASLGIEYAQLTERFDSQLFIGSEFRNDSTTNFSAVKVSSYRERKIYNRYTSINVPITIGKSFGNKRLSYFIDLGALLNLSLKKSGQIFSSAEMSSEFSNLEDSVENSEGAGDYFLLSYRIHTGLSYQLGPKTKIELGPQFHSSFKPEFRFNAIETERNYLGFKFNLVRKF